MNLFRKFVDVFSFKLIEKELGHMSLYRRDGVRVQIREGAPLWEGYAFERSFEGGTGTIVGVKRPTNWSHKGLVSVIPDDMNYLWPIPIKIEDLTVLEGVPAGRVRKDSSKGKK